MQGNPGGLDLRRRPRQSGRNESCMQALHASFACMQGNPGGLDPRRRPRQSGEAGNEQEKALQSGEAGNEQRKARQSGEAGNEQRTPLAKEYHESDFEWQDIAEECQALLEQQVRDSTGRVPTAL